MKKKFMFAMIGAIALTGAVGLSSCSEEEVVDVNPSYNPKTGEVNVDLALNISTNSQTTRMSTTSAQLNNHNFRGIQKAMLLTYTLSGDMHHILNNSQLCDRDYDLDRLIEANGLTNGGTPESRRVLEMSLPTGTNALLFWGKAIKTASVKEGSVVTYDADADQGSITFSPNKDLTKASFKLNPCLPESQHSSLQKYEDLIKTVLNVIVQSELTINATLFDHVFDSKHIKWSDYATISNGKLEINSYDPSTSEIVLNNDNAIDADGSTLVAMSALGEILGNLFVTFNSYRVDPTTNITELRNGEGSMISKLMADLYQVTLSVSQASATTAEEGVAQLVAEKIQGNIDKYFNISKSTTDGKTIVNGCTWKSINMIDELITGTDYSSIASMGAIDNFPSKVFHLPPGSSILTYDVNTNSYSYMTEVPTYAMGAGNSFDPFNYMYPAELCYFGNSPIRVSSEAHKVSQYPDGVANWDNDNEWKAGVHDNTVAWTKNGSVLSSTRSIAMQENINYGTSLLATSVKLVPDPAVTDKNVIYDNNDGLHPGESPKTIEVTDESFKLTGVLIGGQPQEVGWNYLPKFKDEDTNGSKTFLCGDKRTKEC